MPRRTRSAEKPVVVIGAGVAGLVAAFALASKGVPTMVVEKADRPGGKMRRAPLQSQSFDAGPTVLTMRWVFEELFAEAGLSFANCVPTRRAQILARHAWDESGYFDLHADVSRSTEEIARLAGTEEARRFTQFCAQARGTYQALEHSFLKAHRPSMSALVGRICTRRPADLLAIRPFETLWRALGRYFHDPRLRQLFGRYATYCGSSPYDAPATLMLIAHVEQDGVWLVDGGMFRIAEVLEQMARERGVRFRYGSEAVGIGIDAQGACGVELRGGEVLPASSVIVNADAAAVSLGKLGAAAKAAVPAAHEQPRSLSAITWLVHAPVRGFPLLRHNVFFSRDYAAEFSALFGARQVPSEPTIYVCAQDRGADAGDSPAQGAERLMCLINAPADGDRPGPAWDESTSGERVFGMLERFGLRVDRSGASVQQTTPRQFAQLYPGSGGALYGGVTHGWRATFQRPGAGTSVPGLYLAGGSVHPGPGVPMAALSGRLAAQQVLENL